MPLDVNTLPGNFGYALQFFSKHSKFCQYKSCVKLRGTISYSGWNFKFGEEKVQICNSNLFLLFLMVEFFSMLAFSFLPQFESNSSAAGVYCLEG
jgi:hypothetical protein